MGPYTFHFSELKNANLSSPSSVIIHDLVYVKIILDEMSNHHTFPTLLLVAFHLYNELCNSQSISIFKFILKNEHADFSIPVPCAGAKACSVEMLQPQRKRVPGIFPVDPPPMQPFLQIAII